jgi:hypothetical protein
MNLSYPVMAKGTPKGSRNERIGIVYEEMEIEVPEVSGYEAPLAMIVRRPDDERDNRFRGEVETREVRFFDGKLYVAAVYEGKAGRPVAKALTPLARITDRLTDLVVTTVEADMTYNTKSADYWPLAGKTIAMMKKASTNLRTEILIEGGQFQFSEDDRAAAELHRDRARKVQDGLLVIDGVLWEECDEPVYVVSTKSSPGLEVWGTRPVTASISSHFALSGYVEPYVRVFNAAEHDLAQAANALAEPYRKPQAFEPRDHIEVFLPEAVTYPAAERELDRLARYLVTDVSRSLRGIANRGGDSWMETVPTALLTAWTKVRDIVKAYDPLRGRVPEELEPAVETLVAQMDRHGKTYRNWVSEEDIEQLLGRWQDRNIDVEPTERRTLSL